MRCRASKREYQTSTRALVARLALILYLGIVCYLCFARLDSIPSFRSSFLGIPVDKIVHFAMFFPFPIIAFFAKDKANSSINQAAISFLLLCSAGCIIAGITEIIQGSLPYRSEDIHDFAADCLAVCISSIAVLIYDLNKKHHHSRKRR